MTEFTSFISFLAAVTGLIMLLRWMDRVDARLKALEDKAAVEDLGEESSE